MKKLITLLSVATILVFAASAFGAFGTGAIKDSTGGAGEIEVSLSPNVQYEYNGSGGTYYVVGAKNTNGTKTYGTSHDVQGLKMNSELVADDGMPAAASSTSWAGWTTLGE